MPSLRDIRRRIRTVKNTAQITKAMEMVAASRMRRAQQRVVASRPYSDTLRELIAELAVRTSGENAHPLLQQRKEVKRAAVIVMTSDRGLAGALNTNIIRRAAETIVTNSVAPEVDVVPVGRKGLGFFLRRGFKPLADFTDLGDRPTYDATIPVARVVTEAFLEGRVDAVHVVYPKFVSTLTQRPTVEQILPVQPPQAAEGAPKQTSGDYIYEPSPEAILNALVPRYVEVQIFTRILETIASEQSARMIAMRNATTNAKDLVQALSLSANRLRQSTITGEVLEISSAAEAMAAAR
jgi:F-type H+-transporting ATPase subunit gamma